MSNARSPRDVCSTTIGTTWFWIMQAPCYRGSTVSSRWRVFPCRGQELLARLGLLHGDGFDIGDEPVERSPQSEVLAQRLLLSVSPDLLDQLLRVGTAFIRRGRLLTDHLL